MIKKLINAIFFYKRKKKAKILINVFNKMLENQKLYYDGLCNWVFHLTNNNIINYYSYFITVRYIELYGSQNIRNIMNYYPYYWEVGDISPRIDWLKEQINIQKQYL
jgi:hypothetical protein